MSVYLGLDTSNYTTSAACVTDDGAVTQSKLLLPVRKGEHGLRQSDAVFHHTRQLPERVEALREAMSGGIRAVAASDRPQQTDGSYMPCFLVGAGAARQIGAVLGVPVHFFTHQQGHVAAALTGADCADYRFLRFLAFHVSGGTTDALLVEPDEDTVLRCRVIGHSLDLKAGQLIDRVGGMLGLAFPAGMALEKLALAYDGSFSPRPTVQGTDCHLSGVENQCRDRLARGEPPEAIARFCLDSVRVALDAMTRAVLREYGDLPLVFAGGVMSDSLLRDYFSQQYGGRFAPPAYSADNAVGIAALCRWKQEGING